MIQKFTAALAVACAVATPAVSETDDAALQLQLWNLASTEDTLEGYEMFVNTYPDSFLSERAQARIDELRSGSQVETEATTFDELAIFQLIGPVTLDQPFKFGHEAIIGKTINEVIEMSPIYSPVEGLPAEVWQSQSCGGCHEWTPALLCEQAANYIDAEPARYQEKLHPFGGSFKINLRQWALNDCR